MSRQTHPRGWLPAGEWFSALPLWIGGPIVIGLAAADAAVELQARSIGYSPGRYRCT